MKLCPLDEGTFFIAFSYIILSPLFSFLCGIVIK